MTQHVGHRASDEIAMLRAQLEDLKSAARDLLATTPEERREPSVWNPRVERLRAAIAAVDAEEK